MTDEQLTARILEAGITAWLHSLPRINEYPSELADPHEVTINSAIAYLDMLSGQCPVNPLSGKVVLELAYDGSTTPSEVLITSKEHAFREILECVLDFEEGVDVDAVMGLWSYVWDGKPIGYGE